MNTQNKWRNNLDMVANNTKEMVNVCNECYRELTHITKELKNENKFSLRIDEEHSIIIGKYGPVIKRVDGDKNVTFLRVKNNFRYR